MKTVQTDADRRELAPHGTLLCPMEVHHDDPSLFLGGAMRNPGCVQKKKMLYYM